MLHKFSRIRGLHIHATDGMIGHVEDVLLDESTWAARYLVVDTRNWVHGKRVLVSPQVVSAVDPEQGRIDVTLTRDQIRHSKEVDEADIPLEETLPTIWIL